MGEWEKHSVSQLPAHTQPRLSVHNQSNVYFLFICLFFFLQWIQEIFHHQRRHIQKKYTNEAKKKRHRCTRYMEAEEDVRAVVCCACIFNDKMKRKHWNVCRSFFGILPPFMCCISTKHFDIINISNWNRCSCRWTPFSNFILCLFICSRSCSIFFFSNLHSFALSLSISRSHSSFCAFWRVRFHFFLFLWMFNTLSTHKHFKCGHYELPLQISNFFGLSHALLIKLRIYFCLHSILNVLQRAHMYTVQRARKK